jgi:hypothetical protein
MTTEKPHRGTIENWRHVDLHEGYVIVGRFTDHPWLRKHGGESMTSLVVSKNGNEIETLNSRYTLGAVLQRRDDGTPTTVLSDTPGLGGERNEPN